MTIKEKIDQTLATLQVDNPQLHEICFQLNISIERIIKDVKDHLSSISLQMPDYDKHDATHSEKVLYNIEQLLRDEGIRNLTLLEAQLLRLCCYLHDTGMALPNYATSLLTAVEQKDYEFHRNSPIRTIIAELKTIPGKLLKSYDSVKSQFFCPATEDEYFLFLAQEIYDYEQYRIGLSEPEDGEDWAEYCKKTRQGYLRSTHGQRVKKYADNIDRMLSGLKGYDAKTVANIVGNICQGHCVDISVVRKFVSSARICRSDSSGHELTCNERYLAMLLRLGDVIHFSEDRVSRTLYAEHTPMDHESDMHWQVKFSDLTYSIESREGKMEILYFGGFHDPEKYYFLQDYLNWVDDELHYYAAFVQDMEQEQHGKAIRYRLGLPTNVIREHVQAIDFSPDSSLKFRLEQQKVIQLLMGLRLYRNEFMCLRELYQNALDACRCMRAENFKHGLSGDLSIEFGLGTDGGGDYLYCKDEGVGMTRDIVKNYLLRVGNSYYKSAEFRRANMGWDNAVAPVSEFGIGLLSCYMIADRIEVISRHFYSKEKPIWVCMEGTDDYGYYRDTSISVDEWLGDHGTIVKLYLKKMYKDKVTGYLPESPADMIFEFGLDNPFRRKKLPMETVAKLEDYQNSLYHRVQQFVHIPEQGIPVYIQGENVRLPIIKADDPYDLSEKLVKITNDGFSVQDLNVAHIYQSEDNYNVWFGNKLYHVDDPNLPRIICEGLRNLKFYKCIVHNNDVNAGACVILQLPICEEADIDYYDAPKWDRPILSLHDGVYIDGIPVNWEYDDDIDLIDKGIRYHFNGNLRPSLTVDRGNVRNVPEEVLAVKKQLYVDMIQKIVMQIHEHFENNPQAKTEFSKKYLYNYLEQKFDSRFCAAVLAELSLSENLLAEYDVYGAPLNDWFHNQQVSVNADCLRWTHGLSFTLLASMLHSAQKIDINDQHISIQRSLPTPVLEYFDRYLGNQFVFCTDNWPQEYIQYDTVSAFPCLVPQRIFDLMSNSKQSSEHCKFFDSRNEKMTLTDLSRIDLVTMKKMNIADVILLLSEGKENLKLHKLPATDNLDESPKKYVFYCYVSPRPITSYEQATVQQYDYCPEYRQGIEKGWSLLFYRYKDGYTIAPGIVDRAEMVKRIPKEALEHNDGIEYCFTDGTRAF